MKHVTLLSLAAAFGLFSSVAFAGNATANLAVSATVANNCIISTGALTFGAYDPIVTNASTNKTSSVSVSATCTTGATATIRLGQGLNDGTGSAAVPARNLKSGTDTLAYFLYQPDNSTVWGNTTGTGVTATADGASHNYTVYGTIPSGQNVPAHNDYADTVVATIDF